MKEGDIRAFHDSFERCMSNGTRFFDVFYDDFLNSSPLVREKFVGTDFQRQKRVLRASLYLIMNAVVFRSRDFSVLDRTARRHDRNHLNIPPELYELWLDSLMRTVRVCDPEFKTSTEAVWRAAFGPAIEYLVSHH